MKLSRRIAANGQLPVVKIAEVGCLYCCSGKKACIENCLATLFPEIAQQWHSTKNGKLTPFDVTTASNKKIWWVCPKGHEHYSSIANRTRANNSTNCPYCSNQTSRAELRILSELSYIFQLMAGTCENGTVSINTGQGNLNGQFSAQQGYAQGSLTLAPGVNAEVSLQFQRVE